MLFLLPKPKFGASCNSCGMCCTVEPCALAQDVLGCTVGPCIALETEGFKKVCGLVKRPAWYLLGEDKSDKETGPISVFFAEMLGLGHGCDAEDVPHDVWSPVIFMGTSETRVIQTT